MEIYQLRTFVVVARLGHVTKAAETLNLTQPAVTGHIKALEQELGIALFDRRNGRITLSKAGELLLPDVEKTLAVFNATLSKARQIKGEITGRVNIGTPGDPDLLRLGSFLTGLLSAFPLLRIKTRTMFAEAIMEGMANGDLTAGFHIGKVSSADVACMPLRHIRYRIIAPVAHRDRINTAGWRDIAAMPWIGAPDKCHIHQLLSSTFGAQGLTPNLVMEADDSSSSHNLVRAGVGLSLMREDLAVTAVEKGEVIIWSHASVDTQLSFVYAAAAEFDPVIVGMLSVLRKVWVEGS